MKKSIAKYLKVALIIFIIIATIGIGEVLVRLYSRANPAIAKTAAIDAFSHPLHPYFGHNDRSPYMPERITKRNAGEYTILVLGGSTALDIPSPLEKCLNKINPFPDITRFVVYNGAHHGYQSTQDKNVLVHYLSNGSEIDMVVCVEGFNNLIRPLENNAYQLPVNYSGWYWIVGNRMEYGSPIKYYLAKFLSEVSNKTLVRKSMICRIALNGVVTLLMRSYHLQGLSAVEKKISSIPDEEKIEILRNGTGFYRNDVLFMDDIARLKSVRPIFVLHPIMGFERENMTPYEDEFLKERSMYDFQVAPLSVWIEGYRVLQATGRELQEAGVYYLDYTAIFRDTEGNPYRDLMHMNELGWNIMAEKLADYIIGGLRSERPSGSNINGFDIKIDNPHKSPQN